MARKKGMTEGELAALVRSEIDDAVGYDRDDLSAKRALAIDYFNGKLPDVPAEEGRSKVTSRDLSDAIDWIMPGLMRSFTASNDIVCYEPQNPNDEQAASQASDYVNYVFMRECEGYRIIHHGCMDGLQNGNGIWKHWWDTSKQYETLDYSGLSDDAYTLLTMEEDVEVLQHTAKTKVVSVIGPDGAAAEQEETTHDCKLRRVTSAGRLRIECLPPEEFLIARDAKSIEDAKFVGHRTNRTRSQLIADGYDERKVMEIGSESELDSAAEAVTRNEDLTVDTATSDDPLMEEVEVFEVYIQCDYDGDMHAEWRRVVMAGSGSAKSILANDEWSDEVPFSDATPMPMPHRWLGRSLFDKLEDVQKVKTVLQRQTLDNLYLTNHPQRAALQGAIENPDELVNPTLGGVVWEKTQGATREVVTPFVGNHSLTMLEFMDGVIERRTGISRQSRAQDPDALQNQTLGAVLAAQSAAYAMVEMYARNIAELGLRRMFKCILKLIVRHQDRPRMVRLRDQWVEMDPRSWNASMDATISVGLGSGSRDRDMALLTQIAGKQEQILARLGPVNPIVNFQQYANTLRKIIESAGLRSPEQYVGEVSDEQMQQIAQAASQQKPDPEVQKAQMQAQVEAQKAQATIHLEQQKAMANAELERAKAAAELEMTRERNAMEIQHTREKAAAEMQIRREQAILDAQLRREEMALEAELTQRANEMNAAVAAKQADTNIKGKS